MDLLPTFDFISSVWPHLSLQGIEDNVLLADLNANFDYGAQGVDVDILMGTGIETNYELFHPLGLKLLNLVAFDNLPAGNGDGTVLASSARLDNVSSTQLDGVEHVALAGADIAAQEAIFTALGIAMPASGFSAAHLVSVMAGVAQWLPTANSHPWHNAVNSVDVNGDGYLSPIDALHVISALNHDGSGYLTPDRIRSLVPPYLDVNQDGVISPRDALTVIYRLNHATAAEGEGTGRGVTTGNIPAPELVTPLIDSTATATTTAATTASHLGTSSPTASTRGDGVSGPADWVRAGRADSAAHKRLAGGLVR